LDELPPVTLDGLRLSEVRVGGSTVRDAVWVAPLYAAEIVTVVGAATELMATLKVTLVDPSAMVTESGTLATAGLLLDNDMTAPPVGAGPLSVTVAVEELPPVTLDGSRLKEERAALRLK